MAGLTTVYTRTELQGMYLHSVVKQIVNEVVMAASAGWTYNTVQMGHQVSTEFVEQLELELRKVLIDCTLLITRNNNAYAVQVDWSPPLRPNATF